MASEEAKRGDEVAAEEEKKKMEESGEVAETREEEVKGERDDVKGEREEFELEREEVELKSEEAAGEVHEAIETSGAAADAVEESKGGEIPKEEDASVIDEATEAVAAAAAVAVDEVAAKLADETTSEAAMEGKEAEADAERNEVTLIELVDQSVETSEQHEADVAVEEEEEEQKEAQGAVVMDTADEHNESEAVEEEGSDVKVVGFEANDVKVQGYEGNDIKVESCEANVMNMVDDTEKLAMEEGLGGEVAGDDVKVEGYEANVTDMVDDTRTVAMENKAVDMVDAAIETEAVKEGQEGLVEEGDEVNVADKVDASIEKEAVDEGEQGHEGQVEEGHEVNVADMVDETIETEVVGEEGREEHEQNVAVKDMVDETIETTDALEDVGDAMEADPSDVADNVMEETTETDAADDEMDAEDEVAGEEEAAEEMDVAKETSTVASGGKRKRGRKNLKQQTPEKALSLKKEEDVCFICFDGGELVLCDRRGCPKAYHPSCVNRDEAFFQAKGRWNCGWHLCSNCEKNAHYMCYTCTFSLCKACIKDAVILCVKGNKGFCETCMKTVMLVEKNTQDNKDKEAVDFDDRGSWEFLFKDYWLDLKQRLCLTLDDLAQAKNPWKRSGGHANKLGSPGEPYAANSVGGSDSDNSENLELTNPKRRKANPNRMKTRSKGKKSSSVATGSRGRSLDDNTEWASKELLEFVMHMRNGDDSSLSQFDVQALLLEYINRNKCRDPRRKCQIICDSRLQSLFGKPRVGHFEMLKLLESHFLVKEDSQVDDLQGSVVDTEGNQLEADGSSDALAKPSKDKKRRSRKKGGAQSNVEDFAAIDIHNISLIYLRRNLVEDLLDDMENFQDKVAGAFVRIRISGSGQKQDLYRLVQVIGTCKAAEPYKVGKRTTDTLLEILNLNKTEIVTIDIISNQEFTEDECKRLRQSIKCGLINRLTVGDVQEKSLVLQAVRVKDWLETETVRLTHLRDRASEKGRRKELRECVEKLQLLKTPEERQRRLEETIEIHADPNMDPSHESEEDEDEGGDTRQESYTRPTGSGFGRKGREPISPRSSGSSLNDSWSGTRNFSNMNRDFGRNMSSKGYFNKAENITGAGEIVNDTWSQGRETPQTNHWGNKQNTSSLETGARSTQSVVASESSPAGASENLVAPLSTGVAQSVASINETEKIWHYQDPHGKIQGPFSMVQLRKWNNTGYFPPNLRVWKNTEKQEDAVLVTDAIAGKFQKDISITKAQMVNDSHLTSASSGKSQGTQIHRSTDSQSGGVSWGSQSEINSSTGRSTPSSVEVSKYSADGWGTTNLPSPTPSRTPISGAKRQAYENNWSPTPGGNGTRNDPLHGQVTGTGQQLANASMKPVPDVQNLVSNLQNLVESVTNRTTSDNRAWGSGSVPGSQSQSWGGVPSQKIEPNNANTVPAQHSAHGYWANAPPANNGTSSINNTGNSAGNLPTPGFSGVPNSDNWRAAVPAKQSYIQPPAQPQPQAPWGMGVADNQGGVPRMGQENQNSGWVPATGNPSMAWGGSVPGNTNMNWVSPNQGPGWAPSGQGPVRGNAVPSWALPGQGPPSASGNQGWSTQGQGPTPGQGPPLGNVNPAWSAPLANQTQNGDRFSNQRDQGSWNRQPSFGGGGGGGSSRPPFKGQRVCRYYENGHCKKGASCDYLHPDN